MPTELLSPIVQAAATLAGAVFVLVGIWYRDRLETNNKARNTKVQIYAEIRSLLDLIELNNYLNGINEIIADRKAGGNRFLQFNSGRSFTSVYEANLQNLGLLGDAASDVVRFYMIITSAVEDKDAVAGIAAQIKAQEEAGEPVDPALLRRMIAFHELLFGKFSSAVHIGEELMEQLRLESGGKGKRRKPNRAATISELSAIKAGSKASPADPLTVRLGAKAAQPPPPVH